MNVVKRDGTVEQVKFDKISSRIRKLTYALNEDYVDYFQVAQKVISGLYDGVTSTELDKLSAETAASMITTHPDYGKLAARITITSLYKDVAKEFSTVAKELYEYINPVNDEPAGLISDEVYAIIEKNATALNAMIVHDRDFNFDYFGYKTLEKSYLLQRHGKPAETPQQMYMRVSVGIWRDNLEMVQKTYDLLSQGLFTHATPTLFNSGTKRPQMSSCFLLDIDDDSIPGIYKTLSDCAKISQSAGGIGVNIHKIRAKGSYIKGTNGWSNGIVPMLRVFNETARYVDQCFVPETPVLIEGGSIPISEIKSGDKIMTTSGLDTVANVKEFDAENRTIYKLSDGEVSVSVTEEHPFLCVRTEDNNIESIKKKIKLGILQFEWVEAKNIGPEYMVVK
jgi:ribonucleoside-diphosphate reductase alpha chain